MMSRELNDLFYTCALVEYIGRKTFNRRSVIAEKIGITGFEKLLKDAGLNHCLTFEEVSSEVTEEYGITGGTYDTFSDIGYKVPDFQSIGKLYAYMIEGLKPSEEWGRYMPEFFQSPVVEYITVFKTALYIENPSYLIESVKAGYLLEE